MRSMMSCGLILVLLHVSPVRASTKCTTRTWREKPMVSLRKIKVDLDRMPRAAVVQTAWGEMLKSDQSKSVALPALQYLAGTEPRKALRGYYKTMAIVMTRGQLPAQAIAHWPTRAPASKSRYSLPQLCQMYRLAGGK